MDQSCCRIHLKRGPDHDHHIGLHGQRSRGIQKGNGLSKPNDMRAQGMSFFAPVPWADIFLPLVNGLARTRASGFKQLSVEVEYAGTACALVQVVYILCNHMDFEVCLKFCQCPVPFIRGHFEKLAAALVIKVKDQLRIAGKPLR
jgi:hypothetical protein